MVQFRLGGALGALALLWGLSAPAAAQSVMQQCGQQYQAAKAANTLNGMTWNQYRTECVTRLKATPAAATTPPPAEANPLKPVVAATPAPATPAPAPAAPAPAAPAPAPAANTATATPEAGKKPMSAGRTAFIARERQCGSEWKANKATLIAATPGLTWPKYLSQCNTRLKAAGQ